MGVALWPASRNLKSMCNRVGVGASTPNSARSKKTKAIEEAKSMEPMRSVNRCPKLCAKFMTPRLAHHRNSSSIKVPAVTSLDKFEQDATTVGGGSGGGGNTSSSSWMDDSDDASEDDGSTAAKSSRKSQKTRKWPTKEKHRHTSGRETFAGRPAQFDHRWLFHPS